MAEEHLYWAIVHARWMDDGNFAKGPHEFFRSVPAPLRPLVIAIIRRKVRRALYVKKQEPWHSDLAVVAQGCAE